MFKNLLAIAIATLIAYLFYSILSSVMYTYQLVKFFDKEYSLFKHGIVLNGKTGLGSYINVTDIKLTSFNENRTIEERCPGVSSSQGYLTMGFIGDEWLAVCCRVADNNQELVPYKDVGEVRHYLCGQWPNIDHVTRPISYSQHTVIE